MIKVCTLDDFADDSGHSSRDVVFAVGKEFFRVFKGIKRQDFNVFRLKAEAFKFKSGKLRQ